jgi:hypothetical protein
MRSLQLMLRFVGVVQLFFGVLFTLAPTEAAAVLHLRPSAPGWVSTIGYLLVHDLSLRSVAPAAILPVVFVAGLLRWHPRRVTHDATAQAAA